MASRHHGLNGAVGNNHGGRAQRDGSRGQRLWKDLGVALSGSAFRCRTSENTLMDLRLLFHCLNRLCQHVEVNRQNLVFHHTHWTVGDELATSLYLHKDKRKRKCALQWKFALNQMY